MEDVTNTAPDAPAATAQAADAGYPSAADLTEGLSTLADSANHVGSEAPATTEAAAALEKAQGAAPEPATPPPETQAFTSAQMQEAIASAVQSAVQQAMQAMAPMLQPQQPAAPEAPAAPLDVYATAARSQLGDGLPDSLYSRAADIYRQRAAWEPHAGAEGETGARAKARLAALDERLGDLRIMAELAGKASQATSQITTQQSTAQLRDRARSLMTPETLANAGTYPGLSAALKAGTLTAEQLMTAIEPIIKSGELAKNPASIDAALAPWEAAFSARTKDAAVADKTAAATPTAPTSAAVINPAVTAPTGGGGHALPTNDKKYPSMSEFMADFQTQFYGTGNKVN